MTFLVRPFSAADAGPANGKKEENTNKTRAIWILIFIMEVQY